MLFPGLPFWEESWVSSQTLGKNITSTAPGAEKDRKSTALSGTKQNGHFRRQSSIDFGAGMVHLKPEWPIWNRKGAKKHPQKNCQAFPLVLRVKNLRIAAGKQPTKNWQAFPPFRGFKMGQFRSASDQKNAQKQIHERFPFF